MTENTNHPTAPITTEDLAGWRPAGLLVAPAESRAAKIAAIHALAAWLVEHPEEEFDYVHVGVRSAMDTRTSEEDRVRLVLEFADRHGIKPTEDSTTVMATLKLYGDLGSKFRISMTRTAYLDPAPKYTARYTK